MQEIEILVKCYSPKEFVLSKLSSFSYLGEKKVRDTYFYDPLKKNLYPGESGKLKACFRLRDRGGQYFMTYKKDFFDDKQIWKYSDEYEIEISDIEIAEKIINNLGFEELVVADTKKYIFRNQNYEIILEEVENLGLFIEVELLNKQILEKDIERQKVMIYRYLKSIGLNISEELHAGKPELLLKKNPIL